MPQHARTLQMRQSVDDAVLFDRASGQVYTERIIAVARPVRSSHARKALPEDRPSAFHRVRSLQDLAARETLRNLECLTPEALAYVPFHVAKRIWDSAKRLDLLSPQIWQIFAQVYPDEESIAYYAIAHVRPEDSIANYVTFLSSPKCQWLSALTLSNLDLDLADVMVLSKLENMVALDFCGTDASGSAQVITDGTLRHWSRHAQEAGGFRSLQLLILRNQEGVSSRCFKYLCEFPNLNLFAVSENGCALSAADEDIANESGWTAYDSRLPAFRRQLNYKARVWDDQLRMCLDFARETSGQDTGDGDRFRAPRLPLMHLRLGLVSCDVTFSRPVLFFRRTSLLKKRALGDTDVSRPAELLQPKRRARQNVADMLAAFD